MKTITVELPEDLHAAFVEIIADQPISAAMTGLVRQAIHAHLRGIETDAASNAWDNNRTANLFREVLAGTPSRAKETAKAHGLDRWPLNPDAPAPESLHAAETAAQRRGARDGGKVRKIMAEV